jgi:hypothetical protein
LESIKKWKKLFGEKKKCQRKWIRIWTTLTKAMRMSFRTTTKVSWSGRRVWPHVNFCDQFSKRPPRLISLTLIQFQIWSSYSRWPSILPENQYLYGQRAYTNITQRNLPLWASLVATIQPSTARYWASRQGFHIALCEAHTKKTINDKKPSSLTLN